MPMRTRFVPERCSLGRVVVAGCAALYALACSPAQASDGLRVAAWNISNYAGGRAADIQTAVYAVFQDRQMAPDAILLQEFLSQSAVDDFLQILNSAPGSPGDWAAAAFVNGPDTDSAFVYRTTRLDLLGVTTVAVGGASPNHPRNIMRYDVRPEGYTAPSTVIAMYSTHMKSGTTSDDQARRLLEAQRIRDNAEVLDPAWNFLLGGDFNIQSSSQAAYQELVGSQVNNAGRFFDPINTPGSWNNNGSYRFVHTQDPIGAGGMDDRHDQLLVCEDLIDGAGLDYIGNPALPYSITTWDDPNHSYRCWGNDGTSFNLALTTVGNTMVGEAIAIALRNVANGAGHLPVYLDLRVPAKVWTSTVQIDFGQVPQGSTAEITLEVANGGDVALWGASGIETLQYTLDAEAPFFAPAGPHVDPAGPGTNQHVISMDTSAPGLFQTVLLLESNDPDVPVLVIDLTGEVLPDTPACPGDVDGDHDVDSTDLNIILTAFGCSAPGPCSGDADGDGDTDSTDLNIVLTAFGQPCL